MCIRDRTTAIDKSAKVASSPVIATLIDRLLGYKISEWKAQGDIVKQQIHDGYEEAEAKGLGFQYISAFRENSNLLNTIVKAEPHLIKKDRNEIEFENDVFWGLIEHAKTISDDDVQELIAKVMAGEPNLSLIHISEPTRPY